MEKIKNKSNAELEKIKKDLADEFENLFQRPVDLVTDKSLSNPYFINSVNQTKTLLYE